MRVTVSTANSRAAAVMLALVAVFSTSRAYAGPVEQLVEMATPPGTSDSILLRYLNGGGGLFLTTDGGKTWSLQCNSAFLGKGGRTPGPILMLADKTPLLLTSSGIAHSDAGGCGFKVDAPELTMSAVDIAQHPMDASKVYAAVSNPTGMSGLIQRGADGMWTDLGVKDALSPISLRVGLKAGALRIYEIVLKTTSGTAGAAGTAAAGTGAAGTAPAAGAGAGGAAAAAGAGGSGGTQTVTAVYTLRVSDDEAKTWQEYPLPQDTKGGRPRLAAVDPTNVDRVVIVMENDNAVDTVYLSKDGGKTTAKYLDIDTFGGISFAPDGRVWIADSGLISGVSMTRGMYAAANLDAPATRLPMATYAVQCVGWAPDSSTLYACQKFWFGKVDLTTGEFSILMRFSEVSKFVTCPGEDTAAQCKEQLCLDYCGPAHFAVAPVCSSSYNEPSCGKPVAEMEDPNGSSSGTTGAAAGSGTAATGGASAAAGAGGMSVVAGTTAAAGTVAAGSGATTSTPPAKSDGGCSCAVPGSSEAGLGWFAAGAVAAFWMRRRARRRA